MTQPDVLDSEAIDRLRDWGGERLLGQMIRLFLENSADRMDQIRTGLNGADLVEAGRGAHSLKSSAANVGAQRVREIASEMERLCNDGRREEFLTLVPELERAYASASEALAAIERDLTE